MPAGGNANARVASAIAYARAQIGKPYVWATAGPNSFDCSGLIWRAYEHAGYRFTGRPTTWTLVGMGREIPRAQIQPGDLVLPDAGHVQMYTGGGKIIEAPHTGATVIERPEWGPYWHIRRLIENDLTDAGTVPGSGPVAAGATGRSGTGAQSDASLAALDNVLSWTSNAQHWQRVLFVVLGVLVILIGVGRMAGTEALQIVGG